MTKHERYNRSPKGRARYERYRTSERGRAAQRLHVVRLRIKEREARINQIQKELNKP